jgi:hypothetical protein
MEGATATYGKIGWAIGHMKAGHRMRRARWSGDPKLWVAYITSYVNRLPATAALMKNTLDENGTEQLVPWSASQSDLLAEDWEIAE